MTIPALPPLPKGENWQAWAKELRDYLLVERSKVGAATPTTPILRHRMSGESAAENGVLVFDPSGKRIEVSVDGSFEPVTIDADLGTIASQDADSVTITGGDISGITYGGQFRIDHGTNNYPIAVKPDSGADMLISLETDGQWGFINSDDNGRAISALIDNSGPAMSEARSVVTREKGDARYLLESAASTFGKSLIDDTSASAARLTLGLGTMATEATGSYATATALSSLEDEVDERTIGGATINASGYASTERVGGVSYQNNNGNMMMVIITAKSGDGNTGYFQLSDDNNTWLNVARFPANSGTERICSFVVPAGWYYRASRALDTTVDRWTEIY